jgi:hypothetical protein
LKKLLNYSFFLFLDKGLAFVLPLSILFITNNKTIYSNLEAALALSVVLIPFLDFGIKYYVGYCFKQEGDKCFNRFNRLLIVLSLLSLIVAIPLFFISELFFIFVLAVLRSIHINLYQYGQIKGRLTDKLISPILINVAASCCALLMTIGIYYAGGNDKYIVLSFFIFAPVLFIILNIKHFQLNSFFKFDYHNTTQFITKCLIFSAPAIFNTLLVVGFANLTKIYVLENFGESEMVQYSFVFRLAMVIQMCHMAVSGYTCKFFLLSNDLRKMTSYYLIYMAALFLVTLCIAFGVYILSDFVSYELLSFDLLLVMAFAYTLFWCFSSFFDFIYVRINKTKLMLVNSFIFFFTYIVYYSLFDITSPSSAAVGLFISSVFMFMSNLTLLWFNRKKIIV